MANMFDFLDWYGDFEFASVPFDEVDNLILAQLSYLHLNNVVPASCTPADGITVPEAAKRYEATYPANAPEDLGPLISNKTRELLPRMAATGRRYADVRLYGFTEVLDTKTHEQFGALAATLPDGSTYVSFRGTDDSIVGWIEDCEICYRIIPSQKGALHYLRTIAAASTGPLRVGGHSKGGNLAAFAAAFATELDDRIKEVWCNDSPGFSDEVIPFAIFDRLRERVHLFTPEYSVVASLFNHIETPEVILSAGNGVMEHSAPDWQVLRNHIVRGVGLRLASSYVDVAFQQLLTSRDLDGRRKLLDDLYDALTAHNITRLGDLTSNGMAGLQASISSLGSLSETDRQTITNFIWDIARRATTGAMAEAAIHTAGTLTPLAKQVSTIAKSTLARAEKSTRNLVKSNASPKTLELLTLIRNQAATDKNNTTDIDHSK